MLRDTIRYDLGLLKLKPLAGQEAGERNHYISMRHEEQDVFGAHIYGYPHRAQRRDQRHNLWGSNGQIVRSMDRVRRRKELMYTWIDATAGQSGSPALRLSSVGISTAGVFVASCCPGERTRFNVVASLGPIELALIENVTKQC